MGRKKNDRPNGRQQAANPATGAAAVGVSCGIFGDPTSPSLADPLPAAVPAESKTGPGLLGDGASHAGKYNMALARRAIRNGWPISDELRAILVNQMSEVMQTTPKERNQVAAAKVLLQADKLNIDRERIDAPQVVEMNHKGEMSLTHIRQEMLQDPDYLAYLEQRAAMEDTVIDTSYPRPTPPPG